jgi:hypothetical protein
MNLASILFARFNAPNDSFDVAPTRSTVVKLLEAEHFGLLRPGLETGFGACLERFDMTAQDRGWRNSADEVETVRPAEVDGLGAPIMDVGAGRRPMLRFFTPRRAFLQSPEDRRPVLN